jgi:hypothetical protein
MPERDVEESQGERAAHKAVDRERLLPGEDLGTRQPADAEQWVAVYAELLEYKRKLLSVTDSALRSMSERAAHREIAQVDRELIEAEHARFDRRLRFWRRRREELAHREPDPSE